MNKTLIIQSHRDPLPALWLSHCLSSVHSWATTAGYDYRYIDDELFSPLPDAIRTKCADRPVVASDLGRLYALRDALAEGYETVVWLDADVLVINPSAMLLPLDDFALGREVWIESDDKQRLRARKKVHNAVLMFRAGNHFLDFYLETAVRLLQLNDGAIPPQFLGPKLLTALHNVAQFPVWESMAMLSPLVASDIRCRGGAALDMFNRNSSAIPTALNLCASLAPAGEAGEEEMDDLIDRLSAGAEFVFCQ